MSTAEDIQAHTAQRLQILALLKSRQLGDVEADELREITPH